MVTSSRLRRVARLAAGAAAGLLAAATAVGVGELAAAAVRPQAAPVVAVGGALIDRTPRAVKDFAIRAFGERDKLVLLIGIVLVLAAFAAVVGVLARRRPRVGTAGIALFGLVGLAAALTRPGAGIRDALPSVAGAVAAAVVLRLLLSRLSRPAEAPVPELVPAGPGGWREELIRVDRKGASAVDRRGFLVTGAGVGVLAALATAGGRALQRARFDAAGSRAAVRLPAAAESAPALPAAVQAGVRGLDPYVTPNRDFYRVDTALVVPQVPADTWTLRVHGLVDRELELDYQDLLDRPLVERDITLTCVSNEVGGKLAGTARWLGVPLRSLLAEAGVRPGADQLLSTSADGMTIGTPTAVVLDGRDALLAVGMNGEPLPLEHGFPVRMVVPGLYGYVSATKWLVDLELTTFAAEQAYWVRRQWAAQAPILTASRIDVPRPFATVPAGRVAVAGVAWAQRRGIERVEVRVDDGEWRPARLAAAPSVDLWVQWVLDWDATPGSHRLTVRATDRSGRTQTDRRARPFPSGATGWHSVVVTVE